MGYDQHQQPNSSGTLVAVIGVGLVLAILGIIVVAAIGLFWVRARVESQAAVVGELHRAEAEAQRAMAMAQAEQARDSLTPDPRLDFVLKLDREGNISVDGEKIGFDESRARLVKLKDETSNEFSVCITADPECPAKHIIPVLDVCHDVGDIDVRVMSSNSTDVLVTATVMSYEPTVEWDHFDDGTFAAYDLLTLKVVAPQRYAETTLSIILPSSKLPDDSAFRTADTTTSWFEDWRHWRRSCRRTTLI